MNNIGNAYAVWNSVDLSGNLCHVYVNQAGESDDWGMQSEMLAEYDARNGHVPSRPDILTVSLKPPLPGTNT